MKLLLVGYNNRIPPMVFSKVINEIKRVVLQNNVDTIVWAGDLLRRDSFTNLLLYLYDALPKLKFEVYKPKKSWSKLNPSHREYDKLIDVHSTGYPKSMNVKKINIPENIDDRDYNTYIMKDLKNLSKICVFAMGGNFQAAHMFTSLKNDHKIEKEDKRYPIVYWYMSTKAYRTTVDGERDGYKEQTFADFNYYEFNTHNNNNTLMKNIQKFIKKRNTPKSNQTRSNKNK